MITDAEILERLNASLAPSSLTLGMRVLEADSASQTVTVQFKAKREFCNRVGTVQGGYIAAMLDEAAGLAAVIAGGLRVAVPTIEFKVSFLAPCPPGTLRAQGYCRKYGRRIAFVEATLSTLAGLEVARMTASCVPQEAPSLFGVPDEDS